MIPSSTKGYHTMTSNIRVIENTFVKDLQVFANVTEHREHARFYPEALNEGYTKATYLTPNYISKYDGALTIAFKNGNEQSVVVEISPEMLDIITKFMAK